VLKAVAAVFYDVGGVFNPLCPLSYSAGNLWCLGIRVWKRSNREPLV